MNDRTEIETQWLLIRGLARESRHWGNFPNALGKVFGPGTRVDSVDLPGTGQFSEMKSPVSIAEITEFAREKFLEIRTKQRERGETPARRTFLLAISMGGMVATQWLAQWPHDFSGCVLINTSFRGYSPFYRRLNPRALWSFFCILKSTNALNRELEILRLISHRPEIRAETAQAWAKIFASRPISSENFARQLLAASRFTSPVESAPIPTLMLVSQKDRMVDPSCAKEIAKRWNLELRVHPTAGHDLALDAPDWLTEQVHQWTLGLSD